MNELRPFDKNFTINLDYKQMGIGGRGCGSLPLEEFMLDEGKYSYSFYLRPYSSTCGDLQEFARKHIK
jgi:hypothetical protein